MPEKAHTRYRSLFLVIPLMIMSLRSLARIESFTKLSPFLSPTPWDVCRENRDYKILAGTEFLQRILTRRDYSSRSTDTLGTFPVRTQRLHRVLARTDVSLENTDA